MDQNPSNNKANFESSKHMGETGTEFWLARELMPLLGYVKWKNFKIVLAKARQSLVTTSESVENHFSEFGKMVSTGYGTKRTIKDYHLSRYACYLIAQNGDSKKPAIATAQSYFAIQTRRQEIEDKDLKRVQARRKLTETEKRFSQTMYRRNVDGRGIAEIRSAGDEKLFGGLSTAKMKEMYDIRGKQSLADRMPTVGIKAKDLAAEMTTVNTEEKDLRGRNPIKQEHVDNNAEVRGALKKRGIKLENLPPEEDTKKLERKLKQKPKQLEPADDKYKRLSK